MAQKISKKLSFIGENIKKIRQAKKISQADFAAIFNLARPSVGAYEEGRSEPKIETLIQIANHFRISIDVLLTRELTVSEIYRFDLLNKKLNKVHQLGNTKSKSSGQSSIPLVNINNYLNYIVNHENNDFLEGLPQVSMPIVTDNRTVRAFEMDGSEMEYHQQGLHHGDLLIGSALTSKYYSASQDKILTVVHKTGITTRRLEKVTKGEMVLVSDDPNYPKRNIATKEILEVWLIEAVYSTYLKSPTLIEERLLKLENDIQSLKKG